MLLSYAIVCLNYSDFTDLKFEADISGWFLILPRFQNFNFYYNSGRYFFCFMNVTVNCGIRYISSKKKHYVYLPLQYSTRVILFQSDLGLPIFVVYFSYYIKHLSTNTSLRFFLTIKICGKCVPNDFTSVLLQ